MSLLEVAKLDMMNRLSQFSGEKYLSLETFKLDGSGVRTPLWFVEMDGALYVWTGSDSWKVKRLLKNPRIQVVPSGARGQPKGSWVDGEARVALGSVAERAIELLKQKYGVMYKLINTLSRKNRAVVEIRSSWTE